MRELPDVPDYEAWRGCVATEYIARTGRAYPRPDTKVGKRLRIKLALQFENQIKPNDAVDELIDDGLLLGNVSS